MARTVARIITAALIAPVVLIARGTASPPAALELGVRVQRQLAADGSDVVRMTLVRDRFVELRIEQFREHNNAFGAFTKELVRNTPLSSDGKEAIASVGAGGDLPPNAAWEIAHWDISGLSAVKTDVLISIEPQGGAESDAIKLMETAMAALVP